MDFKLDAKKSLGQNFLNNRGVAEKIIHVSDIQKGDIVLEIGPGTGMLTEYLVKSGGNVIAIEKDHRAIDLLKEKFKEEIEKGILTIVEEDILNTKPEVVVGKKPYKVIANIPYYITGEILRSFLSAEHKPESMTLMVQKEVAQRIEAKDGKESILSVSVKVFGEPKLIMVVKPGSFTPAPTIDSAVLLIKNISGDVLQKAGVTEDFFFSVVKAGFAHKRKKLSSNIKEVFNLEREIIEKILEENNFNINIRSEELSVKDWVLLAQKINEVK